jgi:hypothetical protein
VVQREAGHGEEQQPDQAERRSHPVPGIDLAQPERLAALSLRLPGRRRFGHRRRWVLLVKDRANAYRERFAFTIWK